VIKGAGVALTTNRRQIRFPPFTVPSIVPSHLLACLSCLSLPIWQGLFLKYIPRPGAVPSLSLDVCTFALSLFFPPLYIALISISLSSPLTPRLLHPESSRSSSSGWSAVKTPRAAYTVLYLTVPPQPLTLPVFFSRISLTNFGWPPPSIFIPWPRICLLILCPCTTHILVQTRSHPHLILGPSLPRVGFCAP
jgi:hypothetical protein